MAIFTAAAIAAAIGISQGFIATAVAFALNAAVYAAASFGLSYAAKAISGQKEQKNTDNFGVQGKLTGGGAVPRSFGLGYHMTAGSLTYANHHGNFGDTPNAYVTQVIALSDLPRERLVGVWVNGQRITLAAGGADAGTWGSSSIGYPVPEFIRPHNGEGGATPHLWIKYYGGTQTAADAYVINAASSADRPYGVNRIGRGICYAVVTYLADENLWNGFPEFKWELSGVPLYDPSKDSTVGGSGSHRYNDENTWGGDGDDYPVVHAFNILRGFHYNGVWLYGLQNMAPARLPATNWITQVAKCRATIAAAGGAEPVYRCGGQINVDTQAANALETILTSCQGRLSEIGGFYKVHVGEPDTPTFAFSDDDILSTEAQLYKPFFSLSESVNGIQARYPSPAQGWNYDTAPAYYRTDLEMRDGNRRLMASPQFDFVPYAEQVQRLQKSAIEEAQRARTHTLVLPPAFWIVEPGDVGAWTSVRNGYDAKLFRVDSAIDQDNLDVTLNLTEVDPADYDWHTGTEFVPVIGGVVGSIPPPAQGIADWSAQPYALLDDTGLARRPAILISWAGDTLGVSAVQFEVRLASDGSHVTRGRTERVTAGSLIITQGILPATTYQVRGQFIPSTPRDMLWSSWIGVTTEDIRLSLAEFDAAVAAQVTALQRQMEDRITDRLQQIEARLSEAMSRGWIDKHEIRSQIFAQFGAAYAEIGRVDTVAVDAHTAVASLETTVTARFGDVDASITETAQAVATIEGWANARYSLALTVDGVATGFDLFNGGAGFTSCTFRADKFEVQFPGYNGNSPLPVFTIGTLNGSPAIGIAANMFLDGTLNARVIQAGSISTLQLAVNGVDLPNIINGAVSNTQLFDTPPASSSIGTTLLSQNVAIKSGKATMMLSAEWASPPANYAGSRPASAIAFYVDGSLVRQFTWSYTLYGTSGLHELYTPFSVHHTQKNLSDGVHNFQVRIVNYGANYSLLAGQLYITDFRR
ncbi:phage tail protein [Bradyrhizobium ontarionense]|uniref:Phage tail protein n=1 Tax=Bradyrhizobium ontarionense TaxID=2898149 RepID=A0ABY3RDY3_9BRAD|nr:phage tail protein [Bradyrhizobium sp. A19]UFZ05449.1 phage tail protein [Bradyrhizobium sp. A19]